MNQTLASPTTLKQAFNTLDSVIDEITNSEEMVFKIVCSKLQEENQKAQSQPINRVIELLGCWGKIPISEIKEKALEL